MCEAGPNRFLWVPVFRSGLTADEKMKRRGKRCGSTLGFETLEGRRLLAADLAVAGLPDIEGMELEQIQVASADYPVEICFEAISEIPYETGIAETGLVPAADEVEEMAAADPRQLDLSDGMDGFFGTLDATTSEETLMFAAPGDGMVEIAMASTFEDGHLTVAITDSTGNVVESAAEMDGGFALHSFEVQEGDVYQLTIAAAVADCSGSFQLTAGFQEHVDQHADAVGAESTDLELGDEPVQLAGRLESAGDVDTFRFTADSSGEISLQLDEMVENDRVALTVEVTDSNQNLIAQGATNEMVRLSFDASVAEEYFVSLTSANGQTGEYQLSVELTEYEVVSVQIPSTEDTDLTEEVDLLDDAESTGEVDSEVTDLTDEVAETEDSNLEESETTAEPADETVADATAETTDEIAGEVAEDITSEELVSDVPISEDLISGELISEDPISDEGAPAEVIAEETTTEETLADDVLVNEVLDDEGVFEELVAGDDSGDAVVEIAECDDPVNLEITEELTGESEVDETVDATAEETDPVIADSEPELTATDLSETDPLDEGAVDSGDEVVDTTGENIVDSNSDGDINPDDEAVDETGETSGETDMEAPIAEGSDLDIVGDEGDVSEPINGTEDDVVGEIGAEPELGELVDCETPAPGEAEDVGGELALTEDENSEVGDEEPLEFNDVVVPEDLLVDDLDPVDEGEDDDLETVENIDETDNGELVETGVLPEDSTDESDRPVLCFHGEDALDAFFSELGGIELNFNFNNFRPFASQLRGWRNG